MHDRLRYLFNPFRHLLRGRCDIIRTALHLTEQRTELAGHRMEGLRQTADFILRLHADFRIAQISARDALRRLLQFADRPHDRTGQTVCREEDKQQRHKEYRRDHPAQMYSIGQDLRAVDNDKILIARFLRLVRNDVFIRTVERDFLRLPAGKIDL